MQTRLTSHNIYRVAEEMLGTTTRPRAASNAHRDATADQRLHHCADSFLATLNNLLRVLRDQFCAHQSQLRRIVTIVFIFQLVSKLPVLHSAKLRNNIPAPSRQEIIGRIRNHTNIAYDCYRGLSPDRIWLGTTLDGSVWTRDSIVARGSWNTHERNGRFRGCKLAQIDIFPASHRQHDR